MGNILLVILLLLTGFYCGCVNSVKEISRRDTFLADNLRPASTINSANPTEQYSLNVNFIGPVMPENFKTNLSAEKNTFQGTASWYSETDFGILETTANMEVFNEDDLTCAMWDIPFGTMLCVTNLENGKSIVVRVNDRGPAKRLVRQGRVIDLSKKAFSRIAHLKKGLVKVKITFLSTI